MKTAVAKITYALNSTISEYNQKAKKAKNANVHVAYKEISETLVSLKHSILSEHKVKKND